MRVVTSGSLHDFFSEYSDFHDARVTRAEPVVDPGEVPAEVRLTLRYQRRGDYRAGARRTMREVDLVATGVREWTLTDAAMLAGEHCVEAVEARPPGEAIGLVFDLSARVRLVCRALTVGAVRTWEEPTPAWTSEREWSARVTRDDVPTPAEWVDVLASRGHRVAWHLYGGAAVATREVPLDGYEGWYLSLADEDGGLPGDLRERRGLFVRSAAVDGGRLTLGASVTGEVAGILLAASELWRAAGEGEVHCGNCEFSLSEWWAYVDSGRLPPRLTPT